MAVFDAPPAARSSSRRTSLWRWAALAAAWPCALALACSAIAATDSETTRRTMHRVFDALTALVPLALSDSISEWETQDAAVQKSVRTLTRAAEQLAAHGRTGNASFRFLSQSLASESRMIQREVERKRYMSAAYFTERVAETCIACHVRLPATSDRDFAQSLLQRVDRSVLTPFAKASLETAGRQFDAALQTYESQFADSRSPAGVIEFSDALNSYLIVALRVQRDPARAARGIAILERRTDLAAQLEHNLKTWRQALVELEPALREAPSLERAREILDAGRALSEFPLDSADEVHAIVASSLIFRFLETNPLEGQPLAEALYLLARTESFTRRAFEISESGSYLEQAIRAAPHTAIAERAYARLELQTVLQYTGPETIDMPPEVHAWLMQLRDLSGTKPRPGPPRPSKSIAAR
jgi:tetratricopeptide (TPR) repeat protein